jgi:hypothetical protein
VSKEAITMSEPSTTAGITIGLGTITVTGSLFGVDYDMLLAGFFGGLLSLSHRPPMPPLRVAGSLGSAALAAGFFGPVLAATIAHYSHWLAELGGFLRLAAGAGIGAGIHALVPAGLRKIRAWGDSR